MILPQAQRVVKARSFWRLHLTFADVEYEYWNQRRVLMPNIGKDDHPKLWSLIFVLIIALTFCCFVMGQGLNSGRLRCEPCRRTCTRLLHCRRVSTTVRRPCYRQRQVLTRYHRRHRYPHSRNSTVRCRSRHPPSSQSAVCCKAWALAQQQQQPRPPQQASYRKNGSAKALDTTASDRLSP